MESYTPLLERTRVPQPSLQKFAVISIFSKLGSSPSHLGPDSELGMEIISLCLSSASSAVVDQSVRELCRLVADSKMELSRGLMELQSALEGSDPKFVGLFVKGIGFLVRSGFQRSNGSLSFDAETHPFTKVLLSRGEVGDDLVSQVLLFVVHNRQLGMEKICDFLRTFMIPLVLRVRSSDFSVTSLVMYLLKSMASICCSLPSEAIPMFKLLMECMRYLPQEHDGIRHLIYFLENLVHTYAVILKHFVRMESVCRGKEVLSIILLCVALIKDIQLCGVELLETVFGLNSFPLSTSGWTVSIIELSHRILVLQKDLGLQYLPEVSSVTLSLFDILIQSELEHEKMLVLKLMIHLLDWKYDTESLAGDSTSTLSELLLFLLPVINLMSWPSKGIKGVAGELIVMLEKIVRKILIASKNDLPLEEEFPSVSKPGKIVFRLLQHLWFQDQFSSSRFFIDTFAATGPTPFEGVNYDRGPWASKLREYTSWIVQRRKSSLPITKAQEIFVTEMSFLVCSVAVALVMHRLRGTFAIGVLATMGSMDPKLGVPLLLAVLYFSNIYAQKDVHSSDILLNILGMLPHLASHSSMIPLVIQTIFPLLKRDTKPTYMVKQPCVTKVQESSRVLYATAIRLLCQTWGINDRAFGSLQGVLLPQHFSQLMDDRNACLSMAASIRDICRKNPDRGVDLILSISSCIESQDPLIQALGLQSLAHLCEADAVDFYTAWDVIEKHLLDSSEDPILAHSICLLLRWGAMDAEAYPEASRKVLQILWGVCSSVLPHESKWPKARASALDALLHYEISYIEQTIPQFKERSCELLFLETHEDVLSSMERFQIKIITHEHMNRRRLIKEKRVATSKIEKLLDVFPQAIFSTGKSNQASLLPGAALLCLSVTPRFMKSRHESTDVHAEYETALMEIASSLQLSRNSFLALLSLQSWKSFARRWIKAKIASAETAGSSTNVLDKTSKAANDILKSMIRIAEDSIPRTSENIVLAIGALCAVLPSSAHTVKSAASIFLMDWLFHFEHEYHQWSAAISLGLVSSGLHVTDHQKKFQSVTALIEVLCGSKSTLVKGACGIGLGFICQNLLTRAGASDNSSYDREAYRMKEIELLAKIVRSLSLVICELTRSSSQILHYLSEYVPKGTYSTVANIDLELNENVLEEDVWGLAGIVLGLGSSVGALYRAEEHDVVLKIKDVILSWIPHLNPLVQSSDSCNERPELLLSAGSCLALPMVVAFCHRVELMDISELEHLLHGYRELIFDLVSVKKSGFFHESLLVSSCTSAGNLLAYILSGGVYPVECVEGLLELFKKCYSYPNPPIIHFGGMLGIVNSLGAEAGILFHNRQIISSMRTSYKHQDSSHTTGSLLLTPVCESLLTSLMQEMFLVAQTSDDHQLQHYAAWAVSFLRQNLVSREVTNVQNDVQADNSSSQVASHSFSDDSAVMKLSLWLMNLNYHKVTANPELGTFAHVRTVRSTLKCLSEAPRLPNMDWGAIVRRCMRYEAQVRDSLPSYVATEEGMLREESLRFALAHASHYDELLTLLDELSDLPRFRALQPKLQSCLLFHLADLVKLFSGSRTEKLFNDLAEFLRSLSMHQVCDSNLKRLLCISCWKGICQLLDEAASKAYLSGISTCIEKLFALLPSCQSEIITKADQANMEEEFSEAARCLDKVPRDWLLIFLQVDSLPGDDQIAQFLRKVEVKARLVRTGSLPLTELGSLKGLILNIQSYGTWNVLIQVVAALQYAESSVKRQWLVDAVEISCISRYPSVVMQFIGLLSGSCSKYMPLLILDRLSVLSDLPVTLTSLLADSTWEPSLVRFTSALWASMERLHSWVTQTSIGEEIPSRQDIDESESSLAPFVLQVMHDTCVRLRKYLPLDQQIKLAAMTIPGSTKVRGSEYKSG